MVSVHAQLVMAFKNTHRLLNKSTYLIYCTLKFCSVVLYPRRFGVSKNTPTHNQSLTQMNISWKGGVHIKIATY